MSWKYTVAIVAVLLLIGGRLALGQKEVTRLTGGDVLVQGTVFLESEDRTRTPVSGALVEVYGLAQGGHWAVRTDSSGKYKLELQNKGSWVVVVSGPGLRSVCKYDTDFDHTPIIDVVTYPGLGNRLSLDDVRRLQPRTGSAGVHDYEMGGHYTAAPYWPADKRAEYFRWIDERTAANRKLSGSQTTNESGAQEPNNDVASALAGSRPKEAPVLHKPDTAGELAYHEQPSGAQPSETVNGTAAANKEAAEKEKPIKLEARLVNLNISAVNRAGVAVPNLTKDDFLVFENGVRQYITFFEKNDAPVNLMLLLDLSSSASDKIGFIRTAASRFIDLLPPADRIGVAAFTRSYFLISDFTSDHALLKSRIEHTINLEGGTAFYDAMWKAMAGLDRAGVSRKALVVLTDGVDENLLDSNLHPSKHTFVEMLERVSENDVTVYPIYLDTEREETQRAIYQLGTLAGQREHRAYSTARGQLSQVADSTGGTLISAPSVQDLDRAYQRVAAELHSLYSLAYEPKDLRNNGGLRIIKVKTGQEGVVVRTRWGFYDK